VLGRTYKENVNNEAQRTDENKMTAKDVKKEKFYLSLEYDAYSVDSSLKTKIKKLSEK